MIDFQTIANEAVKEVRGDWQFDVYRTLCRSVMYCFGMAVDGDIAEFGTMTGRSAVALSSALLLMNEKYRSDERGGKKAWFFDSFKGLPSARSEVDKSSHHVMKGIWAEGTCSGLNATQFTSLIGQILPNESFGVVEGYFSDTVPKLSHSQRFALLHIDGDLYESAIDALDTLFERQQISAGALILFDDWNCNRADPEFGERRAWRELVAKYDIQFSDEGAYGYVSHKFIVHGYSAR